VQVKAVLARTLEDLHQDHHGVRPAEPDHVAVPLDLRLSTRCPYVAGDFFLVAFFAALTFVATPAFFAAFLAALTFVAAAFLVVVAFFVAAALATPPVLLAPSVLPFAAVVAKLVFLAAFPTRFLVALFTMPISLVIALRVGRVRFSSRLAASELATALTAFFSPFRALKLTSAATSSMEAIASPKRSAARLFLRGIWQDYAQPSRLARVLLLSAPYPRQRNDVTMRGSRTSLTTSPWSICSTPSWEWP
jgi:hypothetical protein